MPLPGRDYNLTASQEQHSLPLHGSLLFHCLQGGDVLFPKREAAATRVSLPQSREAKSY